MRADSAQASGSRAAPPGAVEHVYTVEAGRPFVTALAEAVLSGTLPVPGGAPPRAWDLADITLLLPTRRATRALQDAFLQLSPARALLLPKIRPIFGALDELALLPDADGNVGGGPPAIDEIDRQLALAMLVLRWSEREGGRIGDDAGVSPFAPAAARTPAQAVKLARELARLMDAMEIEDVDCGRLRSLVPEEFSEHWGRTLDFLNIVTEQWPKYLADQGLVSRVQQQKRQLAAQTRALREGRPAAPVIVAGVMSSVPVITEFMRVVAGLPNGAVVLPAIDRSLDEGSWQQIVPGCPEHPQYGLKKLLDALGLERSRVKPLPGAAATPAQRARATLVSEAMRPAGTTERWHAFVASARGDGLAPALAGVRTLEAASAEEEAEAIALILRRVADSPGKCAALVTPDRQLARRVSVRLETWGLEVDDSAGQGLSKSPAGAFLSLVAEAGAQRFAPVPLMTLLKHLLCRAGMEADEYRRAVTALELAAFRAPYLGTDLDGVEAALERAARDARSGARRHPAVRRLGAADLKAARQLVSNLRKAFRPMLELMADNRTVPLQQHVRAHLAAAEALAGGPQGSHGARHWLGDAGETLARLFARMQDDSLPAPGIAATDYPDFYRNLIADETVPAAAPTHPRLSIWGPYESRLQQPDIVILGSLNEGIWPQAADPGPWLNRPMRQELGLPAPEERIGDSAHIFTSLLNAETVYLTRAAKIDGVPTVPSRWLLRLQALIGGLGLSADAGQEPWLAWARMRGAMPEPARPVRAPEPRPAISLRPRRLSVTTIEKWIANPYAVFAERILRLQPLPLLGEPPGPALRGQVVHEALGGFARKYPQELPPGIARELLAIAESLLTEMSGNPRIAAFWAPRFARFADWFAETEPARRETVNKVVGEVSGSLVLDAPQGPFTLEARADRIDIAAGGAVITDYKTAANLERLRKRAEDCDAPQLPLEAAIALAGGFAGLPTSTVSKLRYISVSGGEPAGQEVVLRVDDVAALARQARDGLQRLVAEFDRETTPYRAVRRARFSYTYDAYAHLARVAEWAVESGEEE